MVRASRLLSECRSPRYGVMSSLEGLAAPVRNPSAVHIHRSADAHGLIWAAALVRLRSMGGREGL